MSSPQVNLIFQVEGITCLDCAAKFEAHVAALPGVNGANLNPASGKLTVEGYVDIEDVRRLGKAEGYTIYPADQLDHHADAVEKGAAKPELIRVLISGVILAIAFVLQWTGDRSGAGSNTTIALFTAAALIGGWGNFRKAWFALPRLDFNMAVLMSIAVIGAMLIGEWTEAGVVAFLFAVSELLEAWTLSNARRSIRVLMDSSPKVATVKRADGEVQLPVDQVQIGDIVVIRPGEKIAMDGVVIRGQSAVNEASITGESIPVEKGVSSNVYAGTLNTLGSLDVQVTKRADQSTIAKIIQLVEEAQSKRAPSQAFVDRFAAIYTPIVLGLAVLIAVVPPISGGAEWSPWIYRALSLLVVSCPCALVVSTPVSIVSAISHAARMGVLIKGGVHLEETATIKAFAFDKTGTLTRGKPVVTDVVPLGGISEDNLLVTAMTLESESEHPLANAILEAGHARGLSKRFKDQFQVIAGRGARAVVDQEMHWIGSPRLFEELGISIDAAKADIERLQTQGKTVVLIGTQDAVLGVIGVADEIREEARSVVHGLRNLGVHATVMLTGDNEKAARAVSEAIGVDRYMAELLPDDKVHAVQSLSDQYGPVAMVGDGINDAPALATATVGIAMGGAGTDAALETADIVLMADDLDKLPYTVQLSRKTLRIIKQNVYFSIIIKLIAVAAVFPGWLTLWLAILSDMGATVIVTLNGMRLLRSRPENYDHPQRGLDADSTPRKWLHSVEGHDHVSS